MRNALVASVLLATTLAAQDEAPVEFLRAEIAGPAVWRERMRPTNVGHLLESEAGAAVWRPWSARIDELLRGALGADALAVEDQWLAFGGSVELVLWARRTSAERWVDPKFTAALTVRSDGSADVRALTEKTVRWFATARDVEVPEAEADELVLMAKGGEVLSLPRHGEGASTIWFGDDEDGIRKLAAAPIEAPRTGARATPQDPVFALRWDLAAWLRLSGPIDEEVKGIGVGTLRTLETTLRARGPHVQLELALAFAPALEKGDRGVFAGLFPAHAGVPQIFALVPKEARAWKVGRLDLLALYQAIVGVFGADGAPFDVAAEVLAHMTDEVMVSWHPRDAAGEFAAEDLAVCLAVRLRDEAAFRAGFAKLLETDGGFEVREEEGVLHADQQAEWFLPSQHYAVGKGFAMLALGDDAAARLDAMLAASGREAAMPKEFETLGRGAPEGWNSVGVLDLHTLLRWHLGALFGGLRDVVGFHGLPDADDAESLVESLLPLLREHQLDQVRSLTGCTPEAWRFRVLW